MPPLLPWIKPTAAALIALTVGVSVVYYSSDLDALNNDCRREPPYQVFRRVVGMPVPRGITDLQVAGRHNFTKSWVWMRFDIGAADEKSLATWFGWQVMADPFSPNVPPTSEEIETDYSGHSLFDTQDKQSVGWDAISHIRHPVVYSFTSGADPDSHRDTTTHAWSWLGIVIVDRERQKVYIHALGD